MYLLLLPARCRAVKAAIPDVWLACSLANSEQETAFSGVFRNLANGTEFKKVTKFEASGGGFLQTVLSCLSCWKPGSGAGRAEAALSRICVRYAALTYQRLAATLWQAWRA